MQLRFFMYSKPACPQNLWGFIELKAGTTTHNAQHQRLIHIKEIKETRG